MNLTLVVLLQVLAPAIGDQCFAGEACMALGRLQPSLGFCPNPVATSMWSGNSVVALVSKVKQQREYGQATRMTTYFIARPLTVNGFRQPALGQDARLERKG
jgi:hypothetical protein